MKLNSVREEAVKAYADCNDFDFGPRTPDWMASEPVSVEEYNDIMSDALNDMEKTYNAYDVDQVTEALSDHGDLEIYPAREGSVCVYVSGLKDSEHILDIMRDLQEVKADELSLGPLEGSGTFVRFGTTLTRDEKEKKLSQAHIPSDELDRYAIQAWWD